ncbi:MAG: hypothetical protein GC138_03530 [Gammaproteobacteria bacterium]|nr:hypothetical protein [Gammaproteobacteria bacterium]
MDLISFDAIRTLGLPGVQPLKSENMFDQLDRIQVADGVLFPEYWQVNSLTFAMGKRIFPSIATYLIGHDKVEMTRCFQVVAPRHVPYTLIAANTDEDAERLWDEMCLPFVAKIPRASMGQGVFLIENRGQWRDYLTVTPTLYVQEYLPIDRDLRVVWVGGKIIGGYWRLQAEKGFYNNIAQGGEIMQGQIPVAAAELVHCLATSLGIDHGGFDIAMIGSHPYVFEFNRLFGTQGLAGKAREIDAAIMAYLAAEWGDHHPLMPSPPVRPRAA